MRNVPDVCKVTSFASITFEGNNLRSGVFKVTPPDVGVLAGFRIPLLNSFKYQPAGGRLLIAKYTDKQLGNIENIRKSDRRRFDVSLPTF